MKALGLRGAVPAWMPVVLLVLLITLVSAAPYLAPHAVSQPLGAPWSSHEGAALGTDMLGRDVWSRTLGGGAALIWPSVIVGVSTTLLGALLGLLATRLRILDRALGAITATTMAVPGSIVVLCAAVLLPSTAAVAVSMLLLGVPLSARIVRASAASLANAEYLRAAERRGEGVWYLVFGELIPALSGTVIADAAVRILASLQLLSALHVLGLGPPPPAADWAIMIRENLPGVVLAPWSVAAPAIALTLVSIGVTLAFDALSSSLAPDSTARYGVRVIRGDPRTGAGDILRVAGLRLGPASAPLLVIDDLRLAPGEVMGLRGPSGSGKSTLLETLAGAPRAGLDVVSDEFTVAGNSLPRRAGRRASWRRRLIGWSEQDPVRTIDGRMTVAEVIADGRRHALPARGLLASLGLPEELASRPAATLSGGQAARVSLARALAGSPRLLILDEPTAGLDSGSAAAVADAIHRFAREGGGVVVVSHDESWLRATATRTLEMADGMLRPAEPREQRVNADAVSETRQDERRPMLGTWRDVTVTVRGHQTLPALDATLREGEVVVLVAPSGTGKTSILRTIGGDRLDAQVVVTGSGLPRAGTVVPRHTQLMVQNSAAALNPGRTLLSQCARQARVVLGLSRSEARAVARKALEDLGLDATVGARKPGACSGGERQRAALARALVCRPRILLLDEPTSALDPASRARVLAALRHRAREGTGILVATHETDSMSVADRVIAPLDDHGSSSSGGR